ncbi:MAG TPA: MerR family transcriptional regulator, partial [Firmicutes bacterium]|nr:MerR family transcriptional regulator [Bacillota bacterium]
MTKQEVAERFQIPIAILEEYESWGLCDSVRQVMDVWEYDDRDIERLSLIMTLHDIGFSKEETFEYMRLYLSERDTQAERLSMLNRRRSDSLDEIHFKQMQLDRLDYLRYEL